jgi:hypothetical protein
MIGHRMNNRKKCLFTETKDEWGRQMMAVLVTYDSGDAKYKFLSKVWHDKLAHLRATWRARVTS